MFGEPHRSELIASGMRPIIDLLADRLPWLYSGLVVDRAWLAANRDAALGFLRATVEGNYLAASDAAAAKNVLARELRIADPANLAATYADFKALTPLNAEVTREGAANVIATVNAANASRNPDNFLDTSLHDALREEGLFEAMRRKYPSA
jgi:ABC-type nitrate/sulfonate/bicarbonate transport system substrate-binding protein